MAEFISAEHVQSSKGDPTEGAAFRGVELGDAAQYLGKDAFFNLKK